MCPIIACGVHKILAMTGVARFAVADHGVYAPKGLADLWEAFLAEVLPGELEDL